MTITLTGGVLVAFLGLLAVLLVHVVNVARWTAELQAMVRKHEEEVISLRQSRHEHATKIKVLEVRADQHQVDIERLVEGQS